MSLKSAVCTTALEAAREAARRAGVINQERVKRHKTAFRYGIGLHIGSVTYGNIGTEGRLEFTVIGSAANEAARIESLCKTLGHKLLLSAEFARYCSDELICLGQQELRGVSQTREIFTLSDEKN
jgi:adenylate cyclase